MNKEEQIEEMAFIALKNVMSYTAAKQVAMNFYNAGYRKVPEDSVVLKKEECAEIKRNREMTAEQVIESEA